MLRVSDLHDLLEDEAKEAEVASAFKDDQAVLKQTRKLVEALDKYSVNLTTRWWGPTSKRRKAVLTERGRRHGLRLFTAQERDDSAQLQGMVTAIDITGVITVTSGPKHKFRVTIGADRLSDPAFALGNQVFLLARRKQEVDGVGVPLGHAWYEFVRHIGHPELDV